MIRPDWPKPAVLAKPCPDSLMPSGARTALRTALGAGWEAHATFACGVAPDRYGEPGEVIQSVVVWARRDGVQVDARWESKPGKPMSFKVAWRTPGEGGWPDQLGSREFMAVLRG